MGHEIRDAIFSKLGLNPDTLQRIRLGSGVVGKTGYVVVAGLVVLGVVAVRLGGTWPLLAVAAASVLMVAVYLFGAFRFAHKHPGAAQLEGADLVAYSAIQAGAKDMPLLPPSQFVTSTAIESLPEGPVS